MGRDKAPHTEDVIQIRNTAVASINSAKRGIENSLLDRHLLQRLLPQKITTLIFTTPLFDQGAEYLILETLPGFADFNGYSIILLIFRCAFSFLKNHLNLFQDYFQSSTLTP
jgi:hypothetical protein